MTIAGVKDFLGIVRFCPVNPIGSTTADDSSRGTASVTPDPTGDPFLDDLAWRGQLFQCSDPKGLAAHLGEAPRKAYVGLDPTSDSLTIGNLSTLVLLQRFQAHGHHPVVLAGGGTGLIGDPGGKSAERPLLPEETIRQNIVGQLRIYERLLPGATVVNNADWLTELSYVQVLRDVGKHFSVNEMVKRDSVRNRLEADGISYTEFSYMILQSYDFAHLHQTLGVTLQMGGSDQWGNIVSGVELIRRTQGARAFALTCPLLTKADGTKFGKSESGAVWLTADRTSPYAFHQFWLNADDADMERYVKTFSMSAHTSIAELLASSDAEPGRRIAQRALADELTDRLHGPEARARAEAAAKALFSGDVSSLPPLALEEIANDVPTATIDRARLEVGIPIAELLVASGVAPSNREARQHLGSGAITLNGTKPAQDYVVTPVDLLTGDLLFLRRGKRNWTAVRWV